MGQSLCYKRGGFKASAIPCNFLARVPLRQDRWRLAMHLPNRRDFCPEAREVVIYNLSSFSPGLLLETWKQDSLKQMSSPGDRGVWQIDSWRRDWEWARRGAPQPRAGRPPLFCAHLTRGVTVGPLAMAARGRWKAGRPASGGSVAGPSPGSPGESGLETGLSCGI